MRLPRYRVWAGFTIWIGLSIVDFLTFRSGVLSLLGFAIAFFWSWRAPGHS